MKRTLYVVLAVPFLLMLGIPAAQAVHCPVVVKECRALVAKLEKRSGTDMDKLAQARAGCDEAQRLHESGKHADSIIEAGDAIKKAGQAQGG